MRNFIQKLKQSSVIRILLVLVLFTALLWLVIRILIMLFGLNIYTSSEIESFITSLGYIVQSVFYIVAGIVAVLSYLQAKETIFAPIKTEIFKLQVETFQKILDFFQNKEETDFIQQFDLHLIVELNCDEMIDEYAKTFFKDKIEVPEERIKKRNELFAGIVFLPDTEVFVPNSVSDHNEEKKDEQPAHPALILAKWQKYRHEKVGFTKKCNESLQELRHLIVSPMLPSELRQLLEEFEKVAYGNLWQVRKTLVDVSQELPESCKTHRDILTFNQMYVWNKYNESRSKYEEKSSAILLYINKYLRINQLMK